MISFSLLYLSYISILCFPLSSSTSFSFLFFFFSLSLFFFFLSKDHKTIRRAHFFLPTLVLCLCHSRSCRPTSASRSAHNVVGLTVRFHLSTKVTTSVDSVSVRRSFSSSKLQRIFSSLSNRASVSNMASPLAPYQTTKDSLWISHKQCVFFFAVIILVPCLIFT